MHWPLHAISPATHEILHLPSWQESPLGQTFPHIPQLLLSFERSAQNGRPPPASDVDPPHSVCPVLQFDWQLAPEQTRPALHTWLHVPQLFGSSCVLTHELEQAVSPMGQLRTHFMSMHAIPAPQAVPHDPQLKGSVERLAQVVPHIVPPVPHDGGGFVSMEASGVPEPPWLEQPAATAAA
jgi:hypothetical protein